jgi:hypothetical protein
VRQLDLILLNRTSFVLASLSPGNKTQGGTTAEIRLKTFKGEITDSRKPKPGFAEKYFKISIARRPTDFHLTNITFLGFLDIWSP